LYGLTWPAQHINTLIQRAVKVHRLSQERPSLERLRLEQHFSNATKPRTTKPGMNTGLECY
jgi:hypothetical protein